MRPAVTTNQRPPSAGAGCSRRPLFVGWVDVEFVQEIVVEVIGEAGQLCHQLLQVGWVGVELPGFRPKSGRLSAGPTR
jgi:hypothetical protein